MPMYNNLFPYDRTVVNAPEIEWLLEKLDLNHSDFINGSDCWGKLTFSELTIIGLDIQLLAGLRLTKMSAIHHVCENFQYFK